MSPEALDPRIERSRAAIMQATLDELSDVGYGAMAIESIASRAGVGKATVYRHWSGKLALVESALEVARPEIATPIDGPIRHRIAEYLRALAVFFADSQLSACLPALVSAAQYDDSVRAFLHRFSEARRQQLVDLVDDGIASGQLPAELDPVAVAEVLVGRLFLRRLVAQDPLPPAEVDGIVDLVLGDSSSG